jgi:hypothetical protein
MAAPDMKPVLITVMILEAKTAWKDFSPAWPPARRPKECPKAWKALGLSGPPEAGRDSRGKIFRSQANSQTQAQTKAQIQTQIQAHAVIG